MGCRIFVGHEAGSQREQAYLYCSTSERVFGPSFESEEEADAFLESRGSADPRRLSERELDRVVEAWRENVRHAEVGEERCDVCDQYFPRLALSRESGNLLCPACLEAWLHPARAVGK